MILKRMELNSLFILKIIELGIVIACLIIWEVTEEMQTKYPLIVCSTLGGYTIICSVILIGHMISSIVEKRLNALLSMIGCILFVISGTLIADQFHHNVDIIYVRNALSAGSLMIINGAVFLLDTILICRMSSGHSQTLIITSTPNGLEYNGKT